MKRVCWKIGAIERFLDTWYRLVTGRGPLSGDTHHTQDGLWVDAGMMLKRRRRRHTQEGVGLRGRGIVICSVIHDWRKKEGSDRRWFGMVEGLSG